MTLNTPHFPATAVKPTHKQQQIIALCDVYVQQMIGSVMKRKGLHNPNKHWSSCEASSNPARGIVPQLTEATSDLHHGLLPGASLHCRPAGHQQRRRCSDTGRLRQAVGHTKAKMLPDRGEDTGGSGRQH